MTTKQNKVTVVKIGGSTLGSHDTTVEDIVTLQKQGQRLVVVHGGGKLITEWLNKQGITTHTIRGERVTDAACHVHGGYGLMKEYPVERYLRDARHFTIMDGTTEVMEMVIARQLGL